MNLTTRASAGALFGGVTVLIVGLALRSPIISVSPILTKIQAVYGLDSVAASLLTSLPVLCFGALAFVSPWIGRRYGIERSILVLLVLITAGMVVRALWGAGGLFLGTVLIGAGIAVGNVLMPAMIKRHWNHAVGALMSTLSVSLSLGPTLAALFTVPIYQALHENVRAALLAWIGLPIVAIALFQELRRRLLPTAATPLRAATGGTAAGGSLWREPLAWQVSAFIGLQSLLFYSITAWLPTILADGGLSDVAASLGFSLFTAMNIVGAWVYPMIAVKVRQQSGLAALAAVLWAAGLAGLLFAPVSTAYAWTLVAGFGSGASFSLSLTLFVLRTRDEATTARLSGMAQAIGYSVAATGPLLMGWLFQNSVGWTVPLTFLLCITPLVAIAGIAGGRPLHVGTSRG